MNAIGKLFVVLILIMSIIFMTVAAIVYATHRNWETVAKKRQTELTQTESQLDSLQVLYNRLQGELENQKLVAQQQLAKLQTEQQLLVARNTGIQQNLDELKETRREMTAAVASTQKNNELLADENTGLRTEVRGIQEEIDTAFAKSLAASERVNEVLGQLETVTETAETLAVDVANKTAVLNANGIDPNTRADEVKPIVDGFVSAVRRNGSLRLIEVTIGADDGLRVGHSVEVFRGRKYLGRAYVRKTDPDRSVAEIDPKYLEGNIQEGDRVATRLKLS